jgi:L-fuconolactonase
MRLVDAHTHTWGRDTPELPWRVPMTPPGWDGPYTHADLVADMGRVGVDEAVVVTNPTYGRGPRGNEYTMRSIEAHPDRLYGVGTMDWFADAPGERFEQVVGHDRLLGARMYAAMAYESVPATVDPDADWFLDDHLEPAFEAAARTDAAVYVFPKPAQLGAVEELVGAHPDVTFVIDHLGWPSEGTAPDEPPWTDLETVVEHGNVAVKVSSVPRSATEGWPYPDVHPYLRKLLEWAGPERLVIGSDYPWMDDWAPYDDCLSWLDAVDGLSRRDRAYLQYRSFRQLHDL